MLARISGALGRGTFSAPAPLRSVEPNAPQADRKELIDRFCLEVENVGGSVAHVHSRAEVLEYLTGVLVSSGRIVALSNGVALRGLGIGQWLDESGFRVVGTWKEFAADRHVASEGSRDLGSRDEGAEGEIFEQYKRVLFEVDVGITSADWALADTGTVVMLSGQEQHRLISLLPAIHVCLLDPSKILWSLTELLERERHLSPTDESPQWSMTCITGPSRTADIEQTITMGVHGPQSLHVLLFSSPPELSAK